MFYTGCTMRRRSSNRTEVDYSVEGTHYHRSSRKRRK